MATRLTSLNSYVGGSNYGNSSETPPYALDNNSGTKVCNTNYGGGFWMVLDAGAVYYPSSYYYIYSGNDSPERDPRNWVVQGSNDNSNWTTIDTVSGHGSWGSRQGGETFYHDTITNPYRYYRWYCSAIQSGSIMQISELQLFIETLARYVTVSAGANGSVSPGSGYVPTGTSKTYTITPNTDYKITNITYGGVSQSITNELGMTFSPTVNANATLSVTFGIRTWNITVSAGANGSITPGSGSVNTKTSKTWTITPNTGFRITNITYGGVSQTITNDRGMDFTDSSVEASTTISATFEKIPAGMASLLLQLK